MSYRQRRRVPWLQPRLATKGRRDVRNEKELREAITRAVAGDVPVINVIAPVWISRPLVFSGLEKPLVLTCEGDGAVSTMEDFVPFDMRDIDQPVTFRGCSIYKKAGDKVFDIRTTNSPVRLEDTTVTGGDFSVTSAFLTDAATSPRVSIRRSTLKRESDSFGMALSDNDYFEELEVVGSFVGSAFGTVQAGRIESCTFGRGQKAGFSVNGHLFAIGNYFGGINLQVGDPAAQAVIANNIHDPLGLGTFTINTVSWNGAACVIDGNVGFTINTSGTTEVVGDNA